MPAWLSTCTTTQNQCVMYSVAISVGVYYTQKVCTELRGLEDAWVIQLKIRCTKDDIFWLYLSLSSYTHL